MLATEAGNHDRAKWLRTYPPSRFFSLRAALPLPSVEVEIHCGSKPNETTTYIKKNWKEKEEKNQQRICRRNSVETHGTGRAFRVSEGARVVIVDDL